MSKTNRLLASAVLLCVSAILFLSSGNHLSAQEFLVAFATGAPGLALLLHTLSGGHTSRSRRAQGEARDGNPAEHAPAPSRL